MSYSDISRRKIIPVISGKHFAEKLTYPYLPLLLDEVLISYPYADNPDLQLPDVDIWVDSGSFGLIRYGGGIFTCDDDTTGIKLNFNSEVMEITPMMLLDLQEKIASTAFTMDIPALSGITTPEDALEKSVLNACWALENRRKRNMRLYASIGVCENFQIWKKYVQRLAEEDFDGIAVGGLVPLIKKPGFVKKVISELLSVWGMDRPVHVFGLSKIPEDISEKCTITSDSSTWIRYAASGKDTEGHLIIADPSSIEIFHCALNNLAAIGGKGLSTNMFRGIKTALINTQENPGR
ncbi:MAG: hypothetical protein JXR95_04870 [Deltaproteobacteria bacterium]|nr:hypothetical protein [Deltaproteobacteria bacterium]